MAFADTLSTILSDTRETWCTSCYRWLFPVSGTFTKAEQVSWSRRQQPCKRHYNQKISSVPKFATILRRNKPYGALLAVPRDLRVFGLLNCHGICWLYTDGA